MSATIARTTLGGQKASAFHLALAFFALSLSLVANAQTGPIPANLFGFNGDLSFYYCRNISDDAWSDCEAAFDLLQPRLVRFPGGAISNYYHFEYPYYGFLEKEIKNDPKNAPAWRKNPLTGDENVLFRLVELLSPRKVPVLYVANMFTAGYEQNQKALRFLLDQKVALAGVELGAELYLEQYQSKFPTPEAYIAEAKKWSSNLRRDFPGLKIGVPAAPCM